MFEQLLFYGFAALTVLAAVLLISARNPVQAALFLVLCFVSCAGIWILLHAEFLGIVLILVYVGAVMVLFLFVIMMLDINITILREGFASYLPTGIVVSLVILVEFIILFNADLFTKTQAVQIAGAIVEGSNTKQLGHLLYTQYLYPVELAAVLLTIAIVAAIALTLRRRPGHQARYQNIAEQVKVQAKDRVKVVQMETDITRKHPHQKGE